MNDIPLFVFFRWTKVVESNVEIFTFMDHVLDLMAGFGIRRLFTDKSVPTEIRRSDGTWRSLDTGRGFDGFRMDLRTQREWSAEEHFNRRMWVMLIDREHVAEYGTAFPSAFRAVVPLCTVEELLQRVERYLHLTAPAVVEVWVRGKERSLLHLDPDHVKLAESLQLGLTPGPGSFGGSWYRAHGGPLDAATPEAIAANRVLHSAVTALVRNRARVARAKVAPAAAPVAPPAGGFVPPPPALLEDPNQTVLGGAPAGPALPFRQGAPVVPPPALPIEPAPDAGGTLLVPVPEELRRAAAAVAPTFDPDVTQAPTPGMGPVIPFAGRTTPERARELAGPPSGAAEDAGATVGMAIPAELRARLAEAMEGKTMSLEVYAAMLAHCTVHGEEDPALLSRFGLTPASKQQVQQAYFERFRAEPGLRERFEQLLRDAVRALHRSGGDQP
jgi:hypothetical protein